MLVKLELQCHRYCICIGTVYPQRQLHGALVLLMRKLSSCTAIRIFSSQNLHFHSSHAEAYFRSTASIVTFDRVSKLDFVTEYPNLSIKTNSEYSGKKDTDKCQDVGLRRTRK